MQVSGPVLVSGDGERDVFTIAEFCQMHGITMPTWYRLVEEQRAPKFMRVGRQIRITRQAIEDWRAALQSEPQTIQRRDKQPHAA
jgi:excisionase family DNA binding protein